VRGNDVVRIITENPPRPAHSVWLTVDADFQAHVQGLIADTYRQYRDGWAPRSRGPTPFSGEFDKKSAPSFQRLTSSYTALMGEGRQTNFQIGIFSYLWTGRRIET
jgi:cell division protein FtsI/penicillin-binding protein 2